MLGAAALAGLSMVVAMIATAIPASAQELFGDDFSSGDGQWTTSGGAWAVQDGVYDQSDDDRNARAFAGDAAWTDISIEAKVQPLSFNGSGLAAVLGRVQNTDTYYYLTLRSNGRFEINKLVGGSRTLLAGTSFDVQTGSWYDLRLDVAGDVLTGSVGGEPLLTVTDGQFTSGGIGLKTFNGTARFDDVLVSAPEGDTTPPSAPSDLRVAGVTSSSVELEWNASTDDVQVDGYEVYRVDSPDEPVGTTSDTFLTVVGLSPEQTYEFYAVAVDSSGNVSEESDTVSATTAEPSDVTPSDEPIGYASMNGGTTGGFGADVVQEVVLSEYWPSSGHGSAAQAMYELLYDHKNAPASEGLVIYVDETIRADELDRADMRLEKVQNVSILGVGTQAEFDGVGINLIEADNIVVRNVTIHHVAEGTGDGITVQRDSDNVWLDHNEIYNQFQGVDKDVYDALIDVRKGSEYVTISWNHLHDAWHNGLTASSDSEGEAGDKITYANNWIENTNSRNPLIRFSDVHMLNNYLLNVADTGINVRMGAQVLVEGNYFENVGSGGIDEETGDIRGPVGWFYGSSETGFWNLVNNAYTGTTPHEHLESTTDFTVPYDYDAVGPQEARDQAVQFTGTGIIDVTG